MGIAEKYNNMVNNRSDDELGLFENYYEVLDEVKLIIEKTKAKSIVDIGCGTCNLLGMLDKNIQKIGIDKNIEMINFSKEEYEDINFKIGTFADKPLIKEKVDVVVTTFAFHGLDYKEKELAISNMLGYLKKHGRLIIADFMFKDEEEIEKYKNKYLKRDDLWQAISRKYYTKIDWLDNYIGSLGLTITKKHIINFTWIVEISDI